MTRDYRYELVPAVVRANLGMAYLYENGFGVTQSHRHALRHYRAAAANGDPTALAALARCYLRGLGIKRDPGIAMRLMVDAGSKDRDFLVAVALWRFEGAAGPPDFPGARRDLTKASEDGAPTAWYNLAFWAEIDRLASDAPAEATDSDAAKLAHIYARAAQAGITAEAAVARDREEALRQLDRAVELGHPLARDFAQHLRAASPPPYAP